MGTPCCTQLPAHYDEILQIDLQKNKKQMLLVNVLASVIAVLMIVCSPVPIYEMFRVADELSIGFLLLRLIVMLCGTLLYIVLHEAVHGIFMHLFGKGVRPTFGFTGMYAFAASRAYFSRWRYMIIGLSPVVIWGAVLLILNLSLPIVWFWPIYFIQIMNLSGAAGDLYVSALLLRMPKDMLVQDDGTGMTFYAPQV